MSGAREFIRNGQPHFINSQKVLNLRHKTRKRAYYLIPFMLLFVFTCVGFVGFLYYLDWKFNADIGEFNNKINAEMKIYADKMNAKVFEFEQQIQRLNAQIEDLQKKLDKKQTTDAQNALQESESNKFKAVVLENVEVYPEIEGVEDEELEQVVPQNKTGKLFDNLRPPNAGSKRNRTVAYEELVNDMKQNRHRRGAEMFNTNGANLLENSGESKSAMKHDFDTFTPSVNRNDTSKEKRSGSQNQTNSIKGSQCSCTSCEETNPRKSANLQKSANKRAMSMKKLQNVRDESASYGELDESTDLTEIRKTVIAAHFGADSSRYSVRTHSHYEGNGHLRHPTGEYQDWTPSSWFEELNMHKHFVLLNGNIKVHSAGLYFVYAQIFYSDLSDVNGYAIYLNSQIVLQCITSTYSLTNVTMKSNTCYTGGVIKCNAGDKISIKTMDVNRKVLLESTRSFVGMFKIGEFQNLK